MNDTGIIFAVSTCKDDDSKICDLFADAFTKNIKTYCEIGLSTIASSEDNFPLFCKDGNKIITFYPDKFPPFPCKEIQNGSCKLEN